MYKTDMENHIVAGFFFHSRILAFLVPLQSINQWPSCFSQLNAVSVVSLVFPGMVQAGFPPLLFKAWHVH